MAKEEEKGRKELAAAGAAVEEEKEEAKRRKEGAGWWRKRWGRKNRIERANCARARRRTKWAAEAVAAWDGAAADATEAAVVGRLGTRSKLIIANRRDGGKPHRAAPWRDWRWVSGKKSVVDADGEAAVAAMVGRSREGRRRSNRRDPRKRPSRKWTKTPRVSWPGTADDGVAVVVVGWAADDWAQRRAAVDSRVVDARKVPRAWR